MIAAKPVPIDLSLSSILRLTWTTMPDSTYFRITRARVAQFTNRRNTNNFLDNILSIRYSINRYDASNAFAARLFTF